MEPVCFIDPFAAEEPASVAPPNKPSPVPVPSTEAIPLSRVVFSSGREREVRQLIHDLAVLAARQDPTVP
jgi:hypothetical protein